VDDVRPNDGGNPHTEKEKERESERVQESSREFKRDGNNREGMHA
jgi:hypothetical protein